MSTTATATRKYEMFLALLPTLTDKEVTKELEGIKELASRHGGVFHEQIWGRRDLYYEIAGQTKGVYAVLCFDYDPAMLREMRSELALNTTLLRYNIQSLPEGYVAPVRTKEDKAPASESEEPPKARVVKKKAAQPVPSEMPTPVAEAPSEAAAEPTPVTEEKAEESSEESNSRKKVKHKDLDEGLNRILSDLGSQS